MFAITLPVTYVMVRLVEHGIQKLTVDPTFPKRWGVYFGIKYQKWKKMEAVVATSWVHALKINSQMGFTKQSNPTSRIKILSFTTQLCILSIQSSTLLHLTSRLHETKNHIHISISNPTSLNKNPYKQTSRIKTLSFKPCSIILSWIHETKLQSTSLHNFTFIAINHLHRTYDTHTSFSFNLMCRYLDLINNLCYNDMLIFILTYMIIITYFTIDFI